MSAASVRKDWRVEDSVRISASTPPSQPLQNSKPPQVLLMTGNYWEEAVYAAPPLFGLDRSDMLTAFNWLHLHFPIGGTKIDWRRAQGRHAHWKIRDDVQLASTASGEV